MLGVCTSPCQPIHISMCISSKRPYVSVGSLKEWEQQYDYKVCRRNN